MSNPILAKFGTITGSDFLKGLVVAILTTASASLYAIAQTNTLPTLMQLKQIGIVAIFAGISYVFKNMFTNSQDQLFAKEPGQATTIPAQIGAPAPVQAQIVPAPVVQAPAPAPVAPQPPAAPNA